MNLTKLAILCFSATLFLLSCNEEEINELPLTQSQLNEEGISELPFEELKLDESQVDTPATNEPNTDGSENELSSSDLKLLESDNKKISDEILLLVNEYRASKGLVALTDNKTAKIESIKHTQYQISINDINHDNGNMRAQVIFNTEKAKSFAENVAFGYQSAKGVVDGWINSPGHRKNLEGDYNHSGIGTIANEKGVLYFTHILFKK